MHVSVSVRFDGVCACIARSDEQTVWTQTLVFTSTSYGGDFETYLFIPNRQHQFVTMEIYFHICIHSKTCTHMHTRPPNAVANVFFGRASVCRKWSERVCGVILTSVNGNWWRSCWPSKSSHLCCKLTSELCTSDESCHNPVQVSCAI